MNNQASAGDALTEAIARRLEQVRERIARAAARAGRAPGDITLVAVSKTHPAETLEAARRAGVGIFGENRVQEALAKIEALGAGVEWHLVGHLQRNKVKSVVGRFALIHAVDSVRLIEELERRVAEAGLAQRVLLEINVSGEASKFGAPADQLESLIAQLDASPHLMGEGLMTIPPLELDPEAARPHFARLRRLLEAIAPRPRFQPRHLSMGMSGDFETAIEEGATIVRVGTAIFGARG